VPQKNSETVYRIDDLDSLLHLITSKASGSLEEELRDAVTEAILASKAP
jgi:hypothetical protein